MTECTLCGLPVPDDQSTEAQAEAEAEAFCCPGCRNVYETLEDPAKRPDSDSASDSLLASSTDAENGAGKERAEASIPDDAETAYLAVEGMHCSTCELFLEGAATKQEEVHSAAASYAAETVKVVYDPRKGDLDDLADRLSRAGYRVTGRPDERDSEDADESAAVDAQSRLLVGGIVGMMAMTWYAIFLYPTYFGYDPVVSLGQFDGAYLYGQLAVLTAILLLYTGRPILRGAYVSLRTAQPNVDLLVTIAALAAYTYSVGRLLVGGRDVYFDVTIVVILAVTVGKYYESRIKRKTADTFADLTDLRVTEARRPDGTRVPVDDLEAGDEVLVRPGDRMPVDGTVREGTAAVDESLVSGEPIPETKRPGDDVRGGTVVTDAPLVVEAGDSTETTMEGVLDLLWDVQASRPGAQRVADRLATVFVPLVLALALAMSLFLLVIGAPHQAAVLTGLTVLIVSCPCALGLATPMAVAAGLQSAVRRGVVVTTASLFEHGGDVDTYVFDKTGTLTDGDMAVTDVRVANDDLTETGLLERAAAVERYADHPIAAAICEAADDGLGSPADHRDTVDSRQIVDSFERHGTGVSARVKGESVVVGTPSLLEERGMAVTEDVDGAVASVRAAGAVPVLVGWDGQSRGVLAVGDAPRSDWEQVLDEIGEDHSVVVLTGDAGPIRTDIADHPGVDEVFPGVPPDGKVATVRRLAEGSTVAMVGDGLNDAPALAAADVGIAVDTGTKLAGDAADAILLEGDIRRVPDVMAVAGGTNRRIRENLVWAFAYNGVAIPLALFGLINPLFAALAMASSSLLVVANSTRTPAPESAESDSLPDRTESPERMTDSAPVAGTGEPSG